MLLSSHAPVSDEPQSSSLISSAPTEGATLEIARCGGADTDADTDADTSSSASVDLMDAHRWWRWHGTRRRWRAIASGLLLLGLAVLCALLLLPRLSGHEAGPPSRPPMSLTPLVDPSTAYPPDDATATAAVYPGVFATGRCPPSRRAFFFFCRRPSADVLSFAAELAARTPFGVYVVVDDNTFSWSDADRVTYARVQIVRMSREDVLVRRMTHVGWSVHEWDDVRSVVALDKALTLAAHSRDDALYNRVVVTQSNSSFAHPSAASPRQLRYCRVWLIEDDVLIPSVDAAVRMDAHAATSDADYVGAPAESYPSAWKHWPLIERFEHQAGIPSRTHWRHQMANVVGLSDRYLAHVRAFAAQHERLVFSEIFFPTLAAAANLTAWTPPTLLQLRWRFPDRADPLNFPWDLIASHEEPWNAMWHPVKDDALRVDYRARMQQLKLERQ